MLYANIIGGLNTVYKRLCTWLNDKENYREQTSHENNLIIKIVMFQFINSYLSLFYIAFYLRDVPLLQSQLFAIFISKQLTGNIKESIIPYIRANMNQMKIIDKSKMEKMNNSEANPKGQNWKQILEKLRHYSTSYAKSQVSVEHGLSNAEFIETESTEKDGISQPEIESIMATYPDTFDDYLEMVIN